MRQHVVNHPVAVAERSHVVPQKLLKCFFMCLPDINRTESSAQSICLQETDVITLTYI